jgi:hypothetical protein
VSIGWLLAFICSRTVVKLLFRVVFRVLSILSNCTKLTLAAVILLLRRFTQVIHGSCQPQNRPIKDCILFYCQSSGWTKGAIFDLMFGLCWLLCLDWSIRFGFGGMLGVFTITRGCSESRRSITLWKPFSLRPESACGGYFGLIALRLRIGGMPC